ncbi:MAG: head-tail connector protein [Lacipirellulaceae bacterium]
MLVRLTQPTAADELVSLADLREHCLPLAPEDDLLLVRLGRAARELAEVITRRTLARSTWRLASYPVAATTPVAIPGPPLVSVQSVSYTDPAGVTQTVSPSAYRVTTLREPGLVRPVDGWPERQEDAPLVVSYTAGYLYGEAPEAARQAVLLTVAHWYRHREAVLTGTIASRLPMAADALLASCKWGDYS